MKYLPTLICLIILMIHCTVMAPALIVLNTSKAADILITMFVILLVAAVSTFLVALNSDRVTRNHKEPS